MDLLRSCNVQWNTLSFDAITGIPPGRQSLHHRWLLNEDVRRPPKRNGFLVAPPAFDTKLLYCYYHLHAMIAGLWACVHPARGITSVHAYIRRHRMSRISNALFSVRPYRQRHCLSCLAYSIPVHAHHTD